MNCKWMAKHFRFGKHLGWRSILHCEVCNTIDAHGKIKLSSISFIAMGDVSCPLGQCLHSLGSSALWVREGTVSRCLFGYWIREPDGPHRQIWSVILLYLAANLTDYDSSRRLLESRVLS